VHTQIVLQATCSD